MRKTFISTLIAAGLAGIAVLGLAPSAAHAASLEAPALMAVADDQNVKPAILAMSDESMEGVKDSAYKGKYYLNGKFEDKRKCILKRESNAHYFSTNRSSGYFGAYQFNQALTVGAAWMMVEEHKSILGADKAKAVLEQLRGTEMHKWPRYWQDAAFYTIYNWDGPASGAQHWAGGRFTC